MQKRYIAIIVGVVLILGFFMIYKKPCGDEECFNKALMGCSPAKFYGYRNNNLYLYRISRSFGSTCKLYVRVDKMAYGTEPDLIRLLERKSMKCRIVKGSLISLTNMENLLDYCHGELKEGLLQLMVERLYALVVRDISGVVKKAEDILKV